MREPLPLRNSLRTRESACVEVMTTLHGSTPSIFVPNLDSPSWTRVRGAYYPQRYVQYKPPRPMAPTYLHLTLEPRPTRQFSQLGMPLSPTFQKLMEGGLLTQLAPRPIPQPDLIDQGLVNLGQPCVTTNPLPAHSTHAVPPPPGGIHHIDFVEDDNIHMLSWDDGYEVGIREDDDLLRQLQSTQARISIWNLLASSSTHRDALIWALSQICVKTTTTPEGLIHMMMADRATCIVFSMMTCHLRLAVQATSPIRLLDNGSTLNVYLLAIVIALAYDSTKREVMGTLMIELLIGLATFPTLFQVKFIHESKNDLFLTWFMFDEVHTLEVEDFFRDFVAMSFDQYSIRRLLSITIYHLDLGLFPYRLTIDYFIRGSKVHPHIGDFGVVIDIDGVDELQHPFHHLLMIAPSSPDRASFLYLCFPDETTDCEVVVEPTRIVEMVQPEPASPFDLFGVSAIEVAEEIQTVLALELMENVTIISPAIGDVEIVDFGIDDQPRELKIGSLLSTDERDRLIHLLRSYLDVFAWSYEDMLGLDPSIVQHHLPILPHARPDGKVRICVDFRDLNKSSPKDDFPIPYIDLLVDSTAGATYQRVATTLFHDMMHKDEEVYVDEMIVKSRVSGAWRSTQIRSKPYLTYLCQGLRKRSGLAFEKIKEYLLSPPVLVPPMPGRPFVSFDMALGCMRAQLDDFGKKQAIYYLSKRMLEYEMRYVMIECLYLALYVSQKSIKGSIVTDHLASLPISEGRLVDDDFPNEEFIAMTSLSGWHMYFDGAANHSGFGIGVMLVSPQGDHIPRLVRLVFLDRHPATNNIVEYETCILGLETALELGIRQMEVFSDSNLVLR
ncbi:hypothetical protein AAG906_018913 [Vitis piasezkii]